jgi:hypothetical protein
VLRIRIQIRCFFPLDPGSRSRKVKKSGTGIRDEHPRLFFRELRNSFLGEIYLNALMRIGIFLTLIRVGKIRIPDPKHCSIGPYPAKKKDICRSTGHRFLKSTISLKLTQQSNKLVECGCKNKKFLM